MVKYVWFAGAIVWAMAGVLNVVNHNYANALPEFLLVALSVWAGTMKGAK